MGDVVFTTVTSQLEGPGFESDWPWPFWTWLVLHVRLLICLSGDPSPWPLKLGGETGTGMGAASVKDLTENVNVWTNAPHYVREKTDIAPLSDVDSSYIQQI